jgi:hypothetical protein
MRAARSSERADAIRYRLSPSDLAPATPGLLGDSDCGAGAFETVIFLARNLSRELLATARRFSSSFALGGDPTKKLGVHPASSLSPK